MNQFGWFATATFTAFGVMDDKELCCKDGGDCLSIRTGSFGTLGFYNESHLDNFLDSHKILCGTANPLMRLTGSLDLSANILYPHSIRRSDSGLKTLMFRMEVKPLGAGEVSEEDNGGCVFSGNKSDPDNWGLINKKIISRLFHARIATANSAFECCGKANHEFYICKAIKKVNSKKQLNQFQHIKKQVPKNRKRSVGLRKRLIVLTRDNYKCTKCGASPKNTPNVLLHVDHVIPWSRGGGCHIDNLVTLCDMCNLGKGNRLEIELLESALRFA
jgi:5-methylcytosine-specific restriction endonuclease McrA